MPRDDVPNTSTGDAPAAESDWSSGGPRAQIRDVKDKVVEEARSSIRQARDSATSSLNQSRHRAADSIESIAGAVRGTGERLRSEHQESVANLTDSLADQVERLASYLRTRDLRAVRDDVERFARQQPSVAIGVALAIGLLGARFIKSSQRGAARTWRREDSGPDYDTGTGRHGYGQRTMVAGGGYGGA
jgi:ElaB/YqjD/DUF883 family membrane-anchored ribosome-binding protein